MRSRPAWSKPTCPTSPGPIRVATSRWPCRRSNALRNPTTSLRWSPSSPPTRLAGSRATRFGWTAARSSEPPRQNAARRSGKFGRSARGASVRNADDGAGAFVQNQARRARVIGEIEQAVQRARHGVGRAIADAWQIPVVLDEANDRGLTRHPVIDVVGPGPRRDHQQRQTGTEAAAPVLRAAGRVVGLGAAAITGAQQLIIGHVRLEY